MPPSVHAEHPLFAVKSSRIQGKGAFAARRIRKGQKIIEYLGKRISREEEDRLYDDSKMKRHHTFLFAVDENTTIDASQGGNDARFINHSCNPNCEAVDYDGRVFIEATRNIQPGVELSYDYSFEVEGKVTKEEREQYFCRCGASNCRGTILDIRPPKKRRPKVERRG